MIVNLSATPRDAAAELLIRAPCDDVFTHLLAELELGLDLHTTATAATVDDAGGAAPPPPRKGRVNGKHSTRARVACA